MLKIEVIKFEAMDVITASTAKCTCPDHRDENAAVACNRSNHKGCEYEGDWHNCMTVN